VPNFVRRIATKDVEAKKLKPVELWTLLVLKAGVCRKAKMMKVLFLLERVYGVVGVGFEPHDYGPWSKEVEGALERLTRLGLVEGRPGRAGLMYRLTEKGREVVEKIPLKEPKWKLPYSDVEFFVEWNDDSLMEYIRVNYPDAVKDVA